jgi:hypothetical protein
MVAVATLRENPAASAERKEGARSRHWARIPAVDKARSDASR